MERVVADVLPSAWWRSAEVIVLACGHRHVRPRGFAPAPGQHFDCCFCDDEPRDGPDIGADVPGGGAI